MEDNWTYFHSPRMCHELFGGVWTSSITFWICLVPGLVILTLYLSKPKCYSWFRSLYILGKDYWVLLGLRWTSMEMYADESGQKYPKWIQHLHKGPFSVYHCYSIQETENLKLFPWADMVISLALCVTWLCLFFLTPGDEEHKGQYHGGCVAGWDQWDHLPPDVCW